MITVESCQQNKCNETCFGIFSLMTFNEINRNCIRFPHQQLIIIEMIKIFSNLIVSTLCGFIPSIEELRAKLSFRIHFNFFISSCHDKFSSKTKNKQKSGKNLRHKLPKDQNTATCQDALDFFSFVSTQANEIIKETKTNNYRRRRLTDL
ncbi:CLUMA_CG010685, isoform A [Clunio marinus]|uniref:CLUMA_CG010685, isoform A n=1 Tax=Clunio marinus TaxID=568069 RepID=A0A1J1IC14_9DIPT|nr:CLUMA_CG010685, isoform A [Clunio marinus]